MAGSERAGRGTMARYVAIITDGNGRWARARGVSVNEGHEAGADTVKARLRDSVELGIRELTVYSFSTENWSRPAAEVGGLLEMFSRRIAQETPELHAEGVRMRFIGRREGVPENLCEQMRWAEELTAANDTITLFVAFNYGGRAEILDAARRFEAKRVAQAAAGRLEGGAGGQRPPRGWRRRPEAGEPGPSSSVSRDPLLQSAEPLASQSDEEEFRRCLYAPEMHDPDLIIRTSGERRLSNYLLWQSAYSELVFREEFWPDFTREALEQSLAEFSARRRRFGGR
jgi:undecaprenyl diphosphate synthase